MAEPYDATVDWLTDASLTPEQRAAWNDLRAELISSRTAIAAMEKRIKTLERQLSHDAPTVLPRPEFNREVARMLAFNERYGGISSVVYFNIEGIEAMTEKYGTTTIDSCVREASNILMLNVRGSDVVGRLAPDEFGVLLAHCDNVNAWKKGEQLAAALQTALSQTGGVTLVFKVMFGAYTFDHDSDLSSGLKKAASAMTSSSKGTPSSIRKIR